MSKEYYGSTAADLAQTERDYGYLLNNKSITRFTDWHWSVGQPNRETSSDDFDSPSVLNFEAKHGASFYKDFRSILQK